MNPRRVVITGVGIACPIGHNFSEVGASLRSGRHGIVAMPEWDRVGEMRTRLAGVVSGLELERRWNRKKVRTMGRVALLAAYSAEQALADAKLDEETLGSGVTGLSFGSNSGSSEALAEFCTTLLTTMSMKGLQSTSYLKFMPHTCAANLAQFFGIRGRVVPVTSACASGAQAIGTAYEAVKYGLQDVMIAGGADEMHYTTAVTFDLMFATSTNYNARPDLSPRPFDAKRDGLVVGEGAATVVLESYERARERGATIYAEVLGYGTNCDGLHITAPSEQGMREAMHRSLRDAGLAPDRVDYVNAHGTATDIGDVAESNATREVFGRPVAVSSTKSYTGHTMGACGPIEAAFSIAMLREGFLAPTRNLVEVDPRCADLDYVREVRDVRPAVIMSNNFAFGGVNTSLILGRVD
ncbi:3-oxoacyl-[acyl-carrier-protein] synthase II [Nannocystis exedens]|uniref:3-oxoacyl-[acyl-carrier-protein] synthase II n=1 Tax=Nannocystis exedens TaxID=54 RepID=A0A1I2HCN4_9BACT|nr:beta-ketoacyl-ACP synthase [Nannocystis exedens]PCC70060.1 3-oxoacyl-ACP synthase [Nannocystis exedens]SFF26717.1 3-oxoacyl-[acyl-carrier-protein] synthase II [Nannocystis exedens]